MKKSNETAVQAYLKELSAALTCSRGIKKAFLSDIKNRISELRTANSALTTEELYREIGSPSEIADGFESREDIKDLKSRVKRRNLFCLFASTLLFIAAAILIIVVVSGDDFHMTVY